MTEPTVPTGEARPKSLAARFIGVITAPHQTFQDVVAHPSWLTMALLVVVLTAGATFLFQSTTVGRQASLDAAVRQTEAFIPVSDAMYEEMRKAVMEPTIGRQIGSLAGLVVGPLVIWAIMAGLAKLIFGGLMGGNATFKQSFAVVVHSTVVSTLGMLVMTPVNYLRASATSATNLAVLMPFLPEGSFLARFFGMVDIFMVWWVMVLAVGLAVAFQKKTRTVAWVLFGIYAVIAIGFAAIMAARS